MTQVRAWLVGLTFCALSLLPGCGGSEFAPVSGTVTFDGQPVSDGDIIFQPSDPKHGPDAGKITDGHFKLQVRPGEGKKVEIRAVKPVPGKKGPMGEDLSVDYIPPQYNEKSKLTANVKLGDRNELKFDLTSK